MNRRTPAEDAHRAIERKRFARYVELTSTVDSMPSEDAIAILDDEMPFDTEDEEVTT